MKTKFLLAVSSSALSEFIKQTKGEYRLENLSKDCRVYRPGSYFEHKNLLFSAFHFKNYVKKGKSLPELLGIPDDCTVFIDSGGYSIATGVVKREDWTNKDAFDLSNANGNIFPILDIPVTPTADFDENLRISKESAAYYKANKTDDSKIILNVAHGRSLGEVKKWVDEISKVELDGWALGSSHRGNPKEILKGMFYMLSSGVLTDAKAFHVFGVSSASMLIYFAAIKHAIKRNPKLNYKFDLTFDSSYPFRTWMGFGHLFMFRKFDGFTNITLSNKVDWSKLRDDDFEEGMFCSCPVCQDLKSFPSMMKMEKGHDRAMWGALHNLWQMNQYKREVESLVEMSMDAPELITTIFPSQIARNIITIQDAFDNIEVGEEIISRRFVATEVEESANTIEGIFA